MSNSAKNQAIEDIKNDLKNQHKCFLAFLQYLDPVMDCIVSSQLEEQQASKKHQRTLNTKYSERPRRRAQLVASCFLATSGRHILKRFNQITMAAKEISFLSIIGKTLLFMLLTVAVAYCLLAILAGDGNKGLIALIYG